MIGVRFLRKWGRALPGFQIVIDVRACANVPGQEKRFEAEFRKLSGGIVTGINRMNGTYPDPNAAASAALSRAKAHYPDAARHELSTPSRKLIKEWNKAPHAARA